jgi:uncharacterized membrane protein YdbT with pleckstrin-like domain
MTNHEETLLRVNPAMWRAQPIGFILCLILIPVLGLGLLILLLWWLECRATELRVTNVRTILRRGLLSKRTVEVRHKDVRVLQVSQGIFQRLMGTGDVSIGSAGTAGLEIVVKGLMNPEDIATLIRNRQDG